MSNTDLHDISIFALNLAMQAGDMMRKGRTHQSLETHYKNGDELVTQTDLHIDEFLCKQIRKTFPDHEIVSEETHPDFGQIEVANHPCWVIDPIDGTVNYAHDHVHCAVSIAYVERGTVQLGIVHCPFLHETFHAIRGEFSLLNHKPIHVSNTSELRRALIATGFPYQREGRDELVRRLGRVLQECQDVRRLGSAAIDICWVAAGRLDGYYESVKPWDFAAARLIAEEAGATCGHFSETKAGKNVEFRGEDILITTPSLFETLRNLLIN